MDAHWKLMQTALSPASTPPGKRTSHNNLKRLLFAAGIAALLTGIYFVNQQYNTIKTAKKSGTNASVVENAGRLTATVIDTPVKKIVILKTNQVTPSFKVKVRSVSPLIKIDSLISIERSDTVIQVVATLNNTPASLASFYVSIQKPVQQFIISAARGGEIICKEGTKIFIPPAAFIDANSKYLEGNVTINVQEFYKYSDMIAANLTTTSDGRQLVTGGMIKLTAVQNNRPLQLRNDKAVELSMPAKTYDAEMELFLADERMQDNKIIEAVGNTTNSRDTAAIGNFYGRTLNWQLANRIKQLQFDGKTNFLNMVDEPVRVRETRKKRIGVFHVTDELPMTEEEAKKLLQDKYGNYYDVIKVKKIKTERNILFSKAWIERKHIGDSVKLTVDQAIRWHYINKNDSAFYVQKVKADSIRFIQLQSFTTNSFWKLNMMANTFRDTLNSKHILDSLNAVYLERQQVEQTYNFSIKKMGWINCDRFYKYENKSDFVIDLPADVQADKFVTQLVFTNIRSVMPGEFYQNKIGFLNIPVNMPVYLVGLGERNGKVVSFIQSFKTSKKNVSVTSFEETTPEAFKEKLKQLDL
jgi:hypothetical protein